jgi:CBS domain-containing protein
MTVSAIMMRRFSSIASVVDNDDFQTVADKLALHDIGAVVVLSDGGKLAGLISDGDLAKAVHRYRDKATSLRAKDFMVTEVYTCRSDETETEIMTVMSERNIRHMPVMIGENVIGLVTLDEAVKHRIQKVKQLSESAAQEADNEKRLAMLDKHLKESWNIFAVFRAVCAVQEETGLALLEDRSKQFLWMIGDGDNAGTPLQLKDLMQGHRWGVYYTVRRYIQELKNEGLITSGQIPGKKGSWFRLTDRGRDAFERMTKAVGDAVFAPAEQTT